MFLCMKILSESINFSAAPLDCFVVRRCHHVFNLVQCAESSEFAGQETSAVV